MIQDIYPHKFYNEYRPDSKAEKDSRILCFQGNKILLRENPMKDTGEFPDLPRLSDLYAAELSMIDLSAGNQEEGNRRTADFSETEPETVYAFCVDETEYFLDISGHAYEAEGFEYTDIWAVRGTAGNLSGMIVFTGSHLYQWYRQSRFCGCCGSRTVVDPKERAMLCPSCSHRLYPRLQPAVIVGVINGGSLLLTKYRSGIGYYALVAGFAEIGETLEETVQREVMEEAGIKVKNIRYYKSQPWGIAQDLLSGYYCEVDGDDRIHMDENELKLAEWKTREEIELQPNDYSLTNEMMREFKEGRQHGGL